MPATNTPQASATTGTSMAIDSSIAIENVSTAVDASTLASEAASTGLTNNYVRALAVSGSDLFTGSNGDGIFRSTNNGASWAQANAGLTSTMVNTLVVSGSDLFAGTFGDAGGVYHSTDNGTSWAVKCHWQLMFGGITFGLTGFGENVVLPFYRATNSGPILLLSLARAGSC